MTTPDTQDRAPTVIAMDAHLIHSNRRQFKMRVLDAMAAGEKRIVIDCAHTRYIDSAGINVLTSLRHSAYLHQAQMVIANLNPDMRSVFDTTQLSDKFTIAETVGAAISKMGGDA